jgi:hypothetical protein
MRKTNGYAANEQYKRWLNEVMANKFAAEVLMPLNDVRTFIDRESPSFHIVDKMTDRYGTSLSSCAIRYINTTIEDCALVYSKDGVRQWFIPSNSLVEENSRYTIPKMHRIGQGTSAYSLARGLAPGREVSGRPFASEWFPYCRDRRQRVREFSRYLPAYGGVLSLLWFEEGAQTESL